MKDEWPKNLNEKNKRKMRLVKQFAAAAARLKAIADNMDLSMEERFEARLKLAPAAAQFGARSASATAAR